MLKDQCISITELRTKTKECLEDLEKNPKYVFVNNKPVAVIITIEEYDNYTNPELIELETSEVSTDLKKFANKAKKIKKEDLINI